MTIVHIFACTPPGHKRPTHRPLPVPSDNIEPFWLFYRSGLGQELDVLDEVASAPPHARHESGVRLGIPKAAPLDRWSDAVLSMTTSACMHAQHCMPRE